MGSASCGHLNVIPDGWDNGFFYERCANCGATTREMRPSSLVYVVANKFLSFIPTDALLYAVECAGYERFRYVPSFDKTPVGVSGLIQWLLDDKCRDSDALLASVDACSMIAPFFPKTGLKELLRASGGVGGNDIELFPFDASELLRCKPVRRKMEVANA
jgi:hypothetical protein